MFFQKWREIEQCEPDAFGGRSPDQGYKQGYQVSGYEQECWLAAYRKACREDAVEVARLAREDWKQYFLKWDDWKQILPGINESSTGDLYEMWFGPGGSLGRALEGYTDKCHHESGHLNSGITN